MRKLVVSVAVIALLAGACSKQEAAKGSGAPVTLIGAVNEHDSRDVSGSGASVELGLEADDFYFNPTFVKAAPGAHVTLQLQNDGTQPHTLTIESLDVGQELQPDAKADVTFALPRTGVVNFFCRFHRDRGMQGAFYFTAGATQPTEKPSTTEPAPPGY